MARKKKEETLLQRRCRELGIDEPTFQVTNDTVVVWRLPPLKLSAGGIVIPEDNQSPNVKGVLLAMGPKAMDHLISNGYELGHIVIWKRFAGWELTDRTPEHQRHNNILFLVDKDLLGSDDLGEQIRSGQAKYIRGEDGRHILQRKLLSGRKEKLLALAASTHSPAEAATARKIASGLR